MNKKNILNYLKQKKISDLVIVISLSAFFGSGFTLFLFSIASTLISWMQGKFEINKEYFSPSILLILLLIFSFSFIDILMIILKFRKDRLSFIELLKFHKLKIIKFILLVLILIMYSIFDFITFLRGIFIVIIGLPIMLYMLLFWEYIIKAIKGQKKFDSKNS